MEFAVSDEERSLAIYEAETAEGALSKYAADKAEAARKLALSISVSEMTMMPDGTVTTVVTGRRVFARGRSG